MIFVVIRGRNCEKCVGKCLDSLLNQTYQDWRAMVVLDNPTDNSTAVVNSYVAKDRRIHVYRNSEQYGLGKNMWWAIKWTYCILVPHGLDIIALLDADDWLHKKALAKVAGVYEEHPFTLITYGSYIKVSTGKTTRISREIPRGAAVRKYPWRSSHLKTFRAYLVPYLQEEWFQHKGEWLPCASDVALMIPLIELAGLEHCEHISKGIYYWKNSHTDRQKQIKYEKIVRRKKRVEEIGWSKYKWPEGGI